jgi:hypothetical protein
MYKNEASQIVEAQLVDLTDGSPVTTGTTNIYVTGDGGSQGSGSGGAPTHKGNGLWSYTPTQAETNYDHVTFTFVNAAAVVASIQVYPVEIAKWWQHLIDGTQIRIILARMAAAVLGKTNTNGTVMRDISDSRDAVTATISGNNRTDMTYNDSGA